jgi:ABC-type branched-subunit amino acid transport system permease subunit
VVGVVVVVVVVVISVVMGVPSTRLKNVIVPICSLAVYGRYHQLVVESFALGPFER